MELEEAVRNMYTVDCLAKVGKCKEFPLGTDSKTSCSSLCMQQFGNVFKNMYKCSRTLFMHLDLGWVVVFVLMGLLLLQVIANLPLSIQYHFISRNFSGSVHRCMKATLKTFRIFPKGSYCIHLFCIQTLRRLCKI